MSTAYEGIRNIVLVHGAFADGSGWRGVYDNLTAQGYRVTIAQIPLTSLEDDVAATTSVLDQQDGPTILVGHSWGGTVITEAGVHRNVAGLVYVSALAPDAGETTAQQYEGFAATPDFVIDVGEDGFGFLNPEKFKIGFAADLSDADAAFLRDSQVPINMSVFGHRGEERRLARQAELGGHRHGGQRVRPGDAAAHGHAHRREDHRRPGQPRPVPLAARGRL